MYRGLHLESRKWLSLFSSCAGKAWKAAYLEGGKEGLRNQPENLQEALPLSPELFLIQDPVTNADSTMAAT